MPGGDKNIKPSDNTGGFHVNPQNINKEGRPLKIYNVLKSQGYNRSDIIAAFGEVSFHKVDQLDEIITDPDQPVIVKIIATQMKTALDKGEWSRIKEIMEYVLGKPHQTTDVNIKPGINIDPKEWVGKD